jgi:hypothetical protein
MNAQMLASILAVLLALALSYAPKFGSWFNAQPSETKVQVTGAGLILITVAIFGLSCAGFAVQLGLSVICDQAGAFSLGQVLITALIANQSAYSLFVRPFKSTNPVMKK